MVSRFKVRFAPVASVEPASQSCSAESRQENPMTTPLSFPQSSCDDTRKHRSRLSCRECRRRRVKCDETFPVCLRCQRRGDVCESQTRSRLWQPETPWLKTRKDNTSIISLSEASTEPISQLDQKLLRYWLEKASQIMALDPDNNPFSFPLLEGSGQIPAMIHAAQSIGSAHQAFFDKSKLNKCLEERALALRLIRQELEQTKKDLTACFLTVFLLGLSYFWTAGPFIDMECLRQAQAHFVGGRQLIEFILLIPAEERTEQMHFAIGAYLYWEMACCFLIEPDQQQPLNTAQIFSAVQELGDKYHPILGYSAEMAYLNAYIGRYCRTVVDTGVRDTVLEATLEEQLLAWEPSNNTPELSHLSEAYRSHGLLNLYAVCYRSHASSQDSPTLGFPTEWLEFDPEFVSLEPTAEESIERELEAQIHSIALQTVTTLTQVPDSHPCTNLQGIPLLTAGSELAAEDAVERDLVRKRFRAIYSLNHLPANLAAIQLLEEIWSLRDIGIVVSWLSLMVEHNWHIMLG
ncbi:unnamed protein product [Clonostachys rosea f. rosea IK726]|uniref:Uncharacterized protein n=1 Tax=Clonostachys rosea f. rosea IK726 TaxID=1349383 RepID=A0ACA9TWS1_BIOOC|nr:unnamed protein product [Clonostachys rosea f. rosea IK726]